MAVTKTKLRSELTAPLARGGRPRMVEGSDSIALLPTLTGKGDKLFKRGGMEFAIAKLPEIQKLLDKEIGKAFARAHGRLANIRTATRSFGLDIDEWISVTTGRDETDRLLILTDSKEGAKGALAVEYGRSTYEVTDKNTGNASKVGAMTGKFILHYGFGVKPNSLKGTGGGRI